MNECTVLLPYAWLEGTCIGETDANASSAQMKCMSCELSSESEYDACQFTKCIQKNTK